MTETYVTDRSESTPMAVAAPPLRLPDAASAMEGALIRALDFCAQKMGLEGHPIAMEHLRNGSPIAARYTHYNLAQQVAQALGALDETVQSVSLYDYDATPEDLSFAEKPPTLPIHLIVWVGRKTGALASLVAALDRALVHEYAGLIGPRRLAHVLDVQVVNDDDVANRTGYAALLSSIYNRPIRIWERQ